ncbi:MAG: hypothetical protein WCP06_03110 [Verrucomicrobiota bacterium]
MRNLIRRRNLLPWSQKRNWKSQAWSAALVVLVAFVVWTGFYLRRWTWNETAPIHFTGDIINGYYWGSEVLKHGEAVQNREPRHAADSGGWHKLLKGYWSFYDEVESGYPDGNYQLDYPPLRLLVMSMWVRSVRERRPNVEVGNARYVQPLRNFNAACELVSSILMFFLVRHWVRRDKKHRKIVTTEAGDSGPDRATLRGLFAASLFWLNPAILLNSHGWPQWDVWLIPFYLGAAVAGSKGRWSFCGALALLGGTFKGQMLFVAPIFLLWPLLRRGWADALCVAAGMVCTAAIVTAPFLLQTPAAVLAVTATGILLAGVEVSAAKGRLFAGSEKRVRFAVYGIVLALAAFLAGSWLGGSYAWLRIGFLYGMRHYPYMVMGEANNLPSILADQGWTLESVIFGLSLQRLLRLFYLAALILCAWKLARYERDNSARTLLALFAPWVFMFTLLPQMHERYLLWGAALGAAAVGVSVSLTLLHLVLSLLSTSMIGYVMLRQNPNFAPALFQWQRQHQALFDWLVVGSTVFLLWALIRKSRNFDKISDPD